MSVNLLFICDILHGYSYDFIYYCLFCEVKHIPPVTSTLEQEKEKVEESPIQQQTENVAGKC